MALLKQISVGIVADSKAFTKGVLESSSALDALAASVAKMPSGGNTSFSASGPSGGGAPTGGGAGAGAGGGLSGGAIASVVGALAPLSQLGGMISAQLNAVGGTITTLARRIDSAIKQPMMRRALDEVQTALRSKLTSASTVATESLTRLQRVTLALGPGADRAISAYRGFNNIATIFNTLTNRGDVARKSLSQLGQVSFKGASSGANQLQGSLATIPPVANRAATAARGLALQLGLALGAVGLVFKGTQALVGFFQSGIKGAMDLGETISKTGEVFGAATSQVVSQANTMAKSFGLPKGALLDAASNIGLLGKGAGQTQAESAKLANTMTQLAADASSFFNVPMDTALEKIRSGQVGETEPMRGFGVLLSMAAVDAEAAAMGFKKAPL